jgi:hypothetical protein
MNHANSGGVDRRAREELISSFDCSFSGPVVAILGNSGSCLYSVTKNTSYTVTSCGPSVILVGKHERGSPVRGNGLVVKHRFSLRKSGGLAPIDLDLRVSAFDWHAGESRPCLT